MNKLFLVALVAALCFTGFSSTIANCVTDDGANTPACTECEDGYGLNANTPKTCTACSDKNCADCGAAYATCTICDAGYGFKSGGANAACTACDDQSCAHCEANNMNCIACKDGYAPADADDDPKEACTACANNCAKCATVDASCAACPTNFTKNDTNKSMVFCCNSVNCTGCSAPGTCTSCVDGVKLNEDKGTCFGFKTGASLTLGAIVSVALFSLLF